MPVRQITEEYRRYVLDEIKQYKGLSRPVKSGFAERFRARSVPIRKLHPNPEDEFCDPAIGPNYEIIGDYEKTFRLAAQMNVDPFLQFGLEPLMVEKMSTGGYMIMNGHHRWYACRRAGIRKITVEVANIISEAEILSKIENSGREMCVSFDLDEVLLTDGTEIEADRELPPVVNRMFPKTLRRNAGVLFRELQSLGFDVWVYSGSARSEKYYRALFTLHRTKADGIVNCMAGRHSGGKLREAFAAKYRYSLHVDNESVLWLNTGTKEYDSVPIDTESLDWSAGVFAAVKNLEFLRNDREAQA